MRQVGSLESINIAVGETIGEAYSNVKTVAEHIDEINNISPSIDNVNVVGNDIVNIDTCATNIGDISIAAASILDINSTAGSIDNVNTVAGSIDNVNSVSDSIDSVNTVAPHVTNIDNVSNNMTDVNTVASDISNINAVANDLTNIDAVNANKTNIDSVANDLTNINITANSIDNVNTYAKTYYGSLSTEPTTRPDGTSMQIGDMYFDSTNNQMRVYDGEVWKNAGSTVNGTSQRQTFTAAEGQTTFTITGGYDPTFADVYLQGRKLQNNVDVDVSSGTYIVLATGASEGDIVDVVAYGAFEIANTYTKAEIDTGQVVLDGIKNVDGAGSGLDADTVDGVQGALLGIGGAGYSWVDETANRVAGTTYTNTTGKPIIVRIYCATGTTATSVVRIYIDGLHTGNVGTRDTDTSNLYIIDEIIIPNGSTYYAEITGSTIIVAWFELK